MLALLSAAAMLARFAVADALAQADTNVVTLTVVQPDGTLASGAQVIFGSAPMLMPGPGQTLAILPPNRQAAAGDDGLCAVILKSHYRVLALHPSGVASKPACAVRPSLEIRLEPWARVEGVVRAGGEILAGERLELGAPIHSLEGGNYTGWSLRADTVTDPHGRFAFTNLPPGDYLLSRPPQRVRRSGAATSHRWPFALRAGETQRIDYTFGGRTRGNARRDRGIDRPAYRAAHAAARSRRTHRGAIRTSRGCAQTCTECSRRRNPDPRT